MYLCVCVFVCVFGPNFIKGEFSISHFFVLENWIQEKVGKVNFDIYKLKSKHGLDLNVSCKVLITQND